MEKMHELGKSLEATEECVAEQQKLDAMPTGQEGMGTTDIGGAETTGPRSRERFMRPTAKLMDISGSGNRRRFSQPWWTEASTQWQALDGQLPPDHKARLIGMFVDQIDLSELQAVYRGSGSEAYLPSLMLKIALYESLIGERSPAVWFRHLHDSIPLQWLAMGIQPSRSALYAFRDRLGHVIDPLCDDVIRKVQGEGLVEGKLGVLDGTTVRSHSSRHRLLNQARLSKRLEAIQSAVDLGADRNQTQSERPAWMAATADGRRQQLRSYLKAQSVLEGRLAANAAKPKDRRLDSSKVMVSVSDPEAPMGRDKEKVFGPLYSVEFIVEPSSLLILTFDVFAQATDAGTLPPMLDRAHGTLGHPLDTIITDAGYVSILDLQACSNRGVELIAPVHENDYSCFKDGAVDTGPDKAPKQTKVSAHAQPQIGKNQFVWRPEEQTYRCPRGYDLQHIRQQRKARRQGESVVIHQYQCPAEYCRTCPLSNRCVKNPNKGRIVTRVEGEEFLEAHRRRMETPEAKALRKIRGQVVERSFGDAKAHRGLRKLHGRGLLRAKAEVGLVVLAQNALTLHRLRKIATKADALAA
jgi:transposase